jgi:hypothetical protein
MRKKKETHKIIKGNREKETRKKINANMLCQHYINPQQSVTFRIV